MLLTVSLFAPLYLSVVLSGIPTPLAARRLPRGQAGSKNARESQCAVCPGDIETDSGAAYLAFDQATNEGITMCTSVVLSVLHFSTFIHHRVSYKESSGTEIICPYVTVSTISYSVRDFPHAHSGYRILAT